MEANSQAREQAKKLLKCNPKDIHGLLALTIADGMESDYDAIMIKKQLPGLSMMRQAEADAKTLLAIDPTEQDANVALGMSNYVIGSLPSYKRAFFGLADCTATSSAAWTRWVRPRNMGTTCSRLRR